MYKTLQNDCVTVAKTASSFAILIELLFCSGILFELEGLKIRFGAEGAEAKNRIFDVTVCRKHYYKTVLKHLFTLP